MSLGTFLHSFFRSVPESARPLPPGDEFFLGANLPWITYGCDFGANAWHPGGGVSHPGHRELLANCFRDLSKIGVRLVRWFMLCDGRAGLRFSRFKVSLDASVFPDVDAALDTAGQFGIRVMFVILDFHWFDPPQVERGVQAAGRGPYLTNRFLRGRMLHNAVRPILRRYGQHPAIHSWDVFNEPEWVIRDVCAWAPEGASTLRSFRHFVKEVADLVHSETTQPATLGLARRSSLNLFDGARWISARCTGMTSREMTCGDRFRVKHLLCWGSFPLPVHG